MKCTVLYFEDLTVPWTHVIGAVYISLSVLITLENVVSLFIFLKSNMRHSKSNRIVTSLVCSDLLVGMITLPFSAYQLIGENNVKNCTIDVIRISLSVITIGTSSLNVGLIAFDRYLLLTRLTTYRQQRTDLRIAAAIMATWLIPLCCLPFRFIYIRLYITLLVIMTFGTMVALVLFYFLLHAAVQKSAKVLSNYSREDSQKYSSNHDNSPETDIKTTTTAKYKQSKETKFARSILMIALCYILCLLPTVISLTISMFYRYDTPTHLLYIYIFSWISATINSLINPFIYAAKYPKFKRHLRRLFTEIKLNNKMD